MKQRLRDVFRGPVVFYPLLFTAFPILFLYAYNISETSASQVWLPLGISVGGALVLWAVLSLILRSRAKAGLATAIFLGLFFSYGRLYDGLNYLGVSVPKHAYLLPTMLFAWGYCVYFIGRAKRDFRVTTRLLNVVAVAVIAINFFNIASYEIRLRAVEAEAPAQTTQQPLAGEVDPENLPDIYFIILDEYAHPDTMLEYYDYDNSEFIQGLEDRGFFVAYGSRTPTGSTQHALAQILNMRHVDGELPDAVIHRKLAYNKVAELLKARGYQYLVFGNHGLWGNLREYMENSADVYFDYYMSSATQWTCEFQAILWNTTMLRPFYYQMTGLQYEQAYRRQTLHTLAHLRSMTGQEGPWFVLAHFLCPHEPFVFGPDGEHISYVNWANYADKQFYLGQYVFILGEIEQVVNELLEKSQTPPIIIVQSDHGLRPHHSGIEIGPDEWRKIINAMYLPGMDYSEISESISPVNTFRLIFNHYFGADYLLLEDD